MYDKIHYKLKKKKKNKKKKIDKIDKPLACYQGGKREKEQMKKEREMTKRK